MEDEQTLRERLRSSVAGVAPLSRPCASFDYMSLQTSLVIFCPCGGVKHTESCAAGLRPKLVLEPAGTLVFETCLDLPASRVAIFGHCLPVSLQAGQ